MCCAVLCRGGDGNFRMCRMYSCCTRVRGERGQATGERAAAAAAARRSGARHRMFARGARCLCAFRFRVLRSADAPTHREGAGEHTVPVRVRMLMCRDDDAVALVLQLLLRSRCPAPARLKPRGGSAARQQLATVLCLRAARRTRNSNDRSLTLLPLHCSHLSPPSLLTHATFALPLVFILRIFFFLFITAVFCFTHKSNLKNLNYV